MSNFYREPSGVLDELVQSEREMIRRRELSRALISRAVSAMLIGVSADLFVFRHAFALLSPWLTLIPGTFVALTLGLEFVSFTFALTFLSRRQMIAIIRRLQILCAVIAVSGVMGAIVCAEFMIDLSKIVSPQIRWAVWISAICLWVFHSLVIYDAQTAFTDRIRGRG